MKIKCVSENRNFSKRNERNFLLYQRESNNEKWFALLINRCDSFNYWRKKQYHFELEIVQKKEKTGEVNLAFLEASKVNGVVVCRLLSRGWKLYEREGEGLTYARADPSINWVFYPPFSLLISLFNICLLLIIILNAVYYIPFQTADTDRRKIK